MLTNRCNFELSKFLKEHRFPQRSIEFDSDYYDEFGKLVYNVKSDIDKAGLTFAPFFAEVIDRFELDLDLYLSVFYTAKGYQYRIYDPSEGTEILSNLDGFDMSSPVYELCIREALEYDNKKEGTKA